MRIEILHARVAISAQRGRRAGRTRNFSRPRDRSEQTDERVAHLGRLELSRSSERQRQIHRAAEEDVDAFDGEDLVDVIERVSMFELHADQDLAIADVDELLRLETDAIARSSRPAGGAALRGGGVA